MTTNLDALALDVSIAVPVTLLHPKTRQPIRDENGVEASISIVSVDSPEVQRVNKMALNKRLKVRGRVTMTADELDAERAETLVAATKAWHLVSLEGKVLEVPLTEQTARAVYTDPRFAWIRDQVSEALDDRATFL
jgi:hypothetical protein